MCDLTNESEELTESIPCQNYSCKKNLFFFGAKFNTKNTNLSREFLNCGRRINRPLTQVEIASIYDVSRQVINVIEQKAIINLGELLVKKVGKKNMGHVELGHLTCLIDRDENLRRDQARYASERLARKAA
ncbi:MAG: hypothetical protein EHM36_11525 [Deltaproteobacteria bacterium]|nr:MAG: hypothetical protein EHM36_11525 [Deltaproteobacteria bacterium]